MSKPALAITSLLLLLPALAAAQFRALCLAQFALANQACAFLPPSFPPAHELANPPLTTTDTEPPPPPPNEGRRHRHGHAHRHRHGGHDDDLFEILGGDGGNKVEMPRNPFAEDCCRWIEKMEMECVCEALRVRLPVALVKPRHVYSLQVGFACNVTYHCS